MKLHNFLCLVTSTLIISVTLLGAAISQEIPEHHVRQKYVDSPDTPYGLVFKEYVDLTVAYGDEQGPDFAADIVMEMLARGDHNHTDEDRQAARKLYHLLLNTHYKMAADRKNAETEIMCGQSRASRNADGHLAAMDALDDARAAIADQHFATALEQLDESTRAALFAKLDRLKLAFAYYKLDHKAAYDDIGLDAVSVVDKMCRNLARK